MNSERDQATGRLLPKVAAGVREHVCRRYLELGSGGRVSRECGVPVATVYRILAEAGVARKRYRRLGPDDVQALLADWRAGEETDAIAAKYGVSPGTVQRLARKHLPGLRRAGARRKYTLNEAAFDELSPDALYWLGFLAADGSVGRARPGQSNRSLALSLQERDQCHVEAFRDFLGSDQPVQLSTANQRRNSRSQRMVVFRVCSGRLCDRLESLGIVPNKSDGMEVASALANSPDFWRGCIDGDGSVVLESWADNRPLVVLNGCRGLLGQFATFVECHLGFRPTVHKGHGKAICQVRVNSRRAEMLAALLYDDAATALGRKREVANLFKARRDSLDAEAAARPTECSTPGCARPHAALGLCFMHWQRNHRAAGKR